MPRGHLAARGQQQARQRRQGAHLVAHDLAGLHVGDGSEVQVQVAPADACSRSGSRGYHIMRPGKQSEPAQQVRALVHQ